MVNLDFRTVKVDSRVVKSDFLVVGYDSYAGGNDFLMVVYDFRLVKIALATNDDMSRPPGLICNVCEPEPGLPKTRASPAAKGGSCSMWGWVELAVFNFQLIIPIGLQLVLELSSHALSIASTYAVCLDPLRIRLPFLSLKQHNTNIHFG
jgi:hypothetical protein